MLFSFLFPFSLKRQYQQTRYQNTEMLRSVQKGICLQNTTQHLTGIIYLFFFFLQLNHCNSLSKTVALCHMWLFKFKLRLMKLKSQSLSHISSAQRCSKYYKATAYDTADIEYFCHPRKFYWAVQHSNARSTRRLSLVCLLVQLHIQNCDIVNINRYLLNH